MIAKLISLTEQTDYGHGAHKATVQCVLCGQSIDPENPFDGHYGVNPNTNRKGWMHDYCYKVAYDDLTDDQRDAYLQRIS